MVSSRTPWAGGWARSGRDGEEVRRKDPPVAVRPGRDPLGHVSGRGGPSVRKSNLISGVWSTLFSRPCVHWNGLRPRGLQWVSTPGGLLGRGQTGYERFNDPGTGTCEDGRCSKSRLGGGVVVTVHTVDFWGRVDSVGEEKGLGGRTGRGGRTRGTSPEGRDGGSSRFGRWSGSAGPGCPGGYCGPTGPRLVPSRPEGYTGRTPSPSSPGPTTSLNPRRPGRSGKKTFWETRPGVLRPVTSPGEDREPLKSLSCSGEGPSSHGWYVVVGRVAPGREVTFTVLTQSLYGRGGLRVPGRPRCGANRESTMSRPQVSFQDGSRPPAPTKFRCVWV